MTEVQAKLLEAIEVARECRIAWEATKEERTRLEFLAQSAREVEEAAHESYRDARRAVAAVLEQLETTITKETATKTT